MGGNALIVLTVLNGFSGPSPANGVFGQPNVEVPISDALPRPIALTGRPTGLDLWPDVPPIRMQLFLTRLDPETQQGFFTAHLFVPPRLLTQILGREGHLAVDAQDGTYRLTRFGRGLSLPRRIAPGYVGATRLQTNIPLAQVVNSSNNDTRGFTVGFNLPFQGRPSAFPDDWYELASSVSILAPTSYVFTDRGYGVSPFPIHIAFAAGPAMRGYAIWVVSKHRVDGSFLRLVIKTDSQTRTLAYVTAAVPILLALVALCLLIISLKGGYSRTRLQELAFAVVLGVLAVLPIRQVTVPAGLHGPTRVDLLLALGVTMSVGVLLIAFALQLGLPAYNRRCNGTGGP